MTAQHLERQQESFVIEIRGADKVEALITKEFGGDFDLMSQHLKIMNKRVVLLNPRFVKKHQSSNEVVQTAVDIGNGGAGAAGAGNVVNGGVADAGFAA